MVDSLDSTTGRIL